MRKIALLLIILASLSISISCSYYMENFIHENINNINFPNLFLMVFGSLIEITLWLVTFHYITEFKNLFKK